MQEYNCEASRKLDRLIAQFKKGLVTSEEVLMVTAEILADGIREEYNRREMLREKVALMTTFEDWH